MLIIMINYNHNQKFELYSAKHCSHCTKKAKPQ